MLCERVARHGRQIFQHLQVAGDHGQQVVEIVRDAAGQLADCLHFLDLAQLAFLRQQHGGGAGDRRFAE